MTIRRTLRRHCLFWHPKTGSSHSSTVSTPRSTRGAHSESFPSMLNRGTWSFLAAERQNDTSSYRTPQADHIHLGHILLLLVHLVQSDLTPESMQNQQHDVSSSRILRLFHSMGASRNQLERKRELQMPSQLTDFAKCSGEGLEHRENHDRIIIQIRCFHKIIYLHMSLLHKT